MGIYMRSCYFFMYGRSGFNLFASNEMEAHTFSGVKNFLTEGRRNSCNWMNHVSWDQKKAVYPVK